MPKPFRYVLTNILKTRELETARLALEQPVESEFVEITIKLDGKYAVAYRVIKEINRHLGGDTKEMLKNMFKRGVMKHCEEQIAHARKGWNL